MHSGRCFAGYSPHVVLLHCKHGKDVNSLTLVLMLSLLVAGALITQLQFCCSCPDVLLVSALHLYRKGHGFESRLSVNLFSGFKVARSDF